MTVWCAGAYAPAYQTVIICSVLQVATDDAASGISFGISLCLTPTL